MKKSSCLALILLSLMFSGCAMHYTIPERDAPLNTSDLPAGKLPLRAGILIPDESFTLTKTWVNPAMQSNTLTMTIPFGKLTKKSAQNIFPAVFDRVEIMTRKPYPAGLEVIYAPTINDVTFQYAGASGFNQAYKVQLYMTNRIMDMNGNPIFADETTTETYKMFGAVFSEGQDMENWATIMAQAVNDAFLKASRELSETGELRAYMAKKGGGTIAPPQPVPPSPGDAHPSPPPKDYATVRTKLKDALEKGSITAEQLSRALEESRKTPRSRILDAFLEGKIDGGKFGELY